MPYEIVKSHALMYHSLIRRKTAQSDETNSHTLPLINKSVQATKALQKTVTLINV